jgi:hypothetical protein
LSLQKSKTYSRLGTFKPCHFYAVDNTNNKCPNSKPAYFQLGFFIKNKE